jgi:putative ABC transport system ATP-binding protein
MIELKNVSVCVHKGKEHEKTILKNIYLTLEKGEFVTVIGSNGAGKSTLLNTLSGEYLPTHGQVLFNKHDVSGLDASKRAPWVARVFQDPLTGTCSDLSIAENMSLGKNRGKPSTLAQALTSEDRAQFQALLKTLNLDLDNRLDAPIGTLSGGQRQAISLLMATLAPLDILLLDEHTSALDPKTAAFVMHLSEKIIKENNLCALMVTHSLQQALMSGTRTIMLHAGEIIYDVRGEERRHLSIHDLLQQFERHKVDEDGLLLQR